MKTFFGVLGIIFLVVIVVGGVGFALIAMQGSALDTIGVRLLTLRINTLDNEGKAYADAVIPAIAANWSEKELLDRESPEFRQTVTQQQLDQLFQRLAGLGHLQKCEPAQGHTIISITTRGKEVKADYTAKATFDKGEAVVQLSIIKHDDQWQVLGLFVKPTVLQQQQQQPH